MLYNKTKQFALFGLKLTGACAVLAAGSLFGSHYMDSKVLEIAGAKIQKIETELDLYKQKDADLRKKIEEAKEIELHIIKSMALAKAKLSDVQKASITSILTKVAISEFSNFQQRELWIAVIANESKFSPTVVSPAGAIGIGQVMPSSGKWYGERCGIEDVTKQDLFDPNINALVSACIFREMLKSVGGAPSLSLIAYNAGQFSKDIKNIDNMGSINTESANYVAKISRFLEKTRSVNINSSK